MTVAGFTVDTAFCQPFQTEHSQRHINRSAAVILGRLTERCSTPI